MSEYSELVERARADDDVLGLILTGSRGRELPRASGFGPRRPARRCGTIREDDVLDAARLAGRGRGADRVEFELAGLPGSGSEWDRYSYVHCQLVLDKLDGEISRLVDAKAHAGRGAKPACSPRRARRLRQLVLPRRAQPSERSPVRGAARRRRVGRPLPHRPVRTSPPSAALQQVSRLGASARATRATTWRSTCCFRACRGSSGRATSPSSGRSFAMSKCSPASRGHGEVIDGWEPDVAWLRGD